ncbi:MAG: penicillin-binding transpeptidase domain-containing protein [Firmicutes bacterium]|nr:penicillin-binding transpeptidase domain-containing protein [Bacillota bacterium]
MLAVTFLFFALFLRLGCIQLIDGRELQRRATDQWFRELPLSAPRGHIYDVNGLVLADNRDVFTVYVRPRAVEDFELVARELSVPLRLDQRALYQKISTTRVSEITIKRQVEVSAVEELQAKNIPGIYFAPGTRRNYPQNEILSQILGFTNIDNVGQNGLEGFYDRYLRGVDGMAFTNTDMAGREIEDSVTRYLPAIPGANLHLAMDLNIQSFAEFAIFQAMTEWRAQSAAMIVQDVQSGAILALAQTPSFDLNEPPRDNLDLLNALSKNRMIVDVYEPGSTFKIFTTAAAIEHGVVQDSCRFFCRGSYLVDGQRIRCWRSIGHGSVDLAQGVMVSCNVVFMNLALRLGVDRLYDSILNFGFNQRTNVDFFGESRGMMIDRSLVKNIDLARIGFGHAVAVTPLQLITAVSAVVNGGRLMEPHFVSHITCSRGNEIYRRIPRQTRQAISPQTSEMMRGLLENTVTGGGGRHAGVEGFRVGGKTGTAQKYGADGTVAQGKYISSFVGFAPVENPRYAILMLLDEPGPGAYYGSIVAAPAAGKVFRNIFDYRAMTPTQPIETPQYITMPDFYGMTATESAQILRSLGLHFEISGTEGRVNSTLPIAGSQVRVGSVALMRIGSTI